MAGLVVLLRVRDSQTGATEDVPLAGLFVAVGHEPRSDAERYLAALDRSTAVCCPGSRTA